VLLFDALSWLFAGLVFVNENCEGNGNWACMDVIRTIAKVLLYSTPVITILAMLAALKASTTR
jgi:hypothetical protein